MTHPRILTWVATFFITTSLKWRKNICLSNLRIIRSIKTRDAMYLKFRRCNQHHVEYNTLKNNLHVFNCNVKKTIREAKIQYYDELFSQYKSDIKKTWKTISDIICKSNKKRKTLDKIIVDSKIFTNKEEICHEFNAFLQTKAQSWQLKLNPSQIKLKTTFWKSEH